MLNYFSKFILEGANMKNLDDIKNENELIKSYIDEAIGLLLQKNINECMKCLENLKLFVSSVYSIKYFFFDEDDED